MESKSRLKERLGRLFRPSALLRSSCNSTTSGSIFSTSNATNSNSSSRSLSTAATATTESNSIALDPVFVPHDALLRRSSSSNGGKLERSLSFSASSRMLSLDCSGCRPSKSAQADVVSVVARIDHENNINNTKKTEKVELNSGAANEIDGGGGEEKVIKKKNNETIGGGNNAKKKNKKKKKKKPPLLVSNPYGFGSSSEESEFFSSDEIIDDNEDETETFFSSRSFSSDSSEFYRRPSPRQKKNKSKKPAKSSRRPPPAGRRRSTDSHDGHRPVVSLFSEDEEGEEKNGIPVMKRSSDPYIDFRDSMAEMIVERQIFGARDLERLLHCYLSLNSAHHHPVILRAFADISEVLFGH